ncbi:MAG: AraC family transcriptional regulator [Bacteroidota bacterium]
MKTVITANELNEMFFENYVEHHLNSTPDGYTERHFSSKLITGAGSFWDITFDGIYIGYGQLSLSKRTQINYEVDRDAVMMLFTFSGCTVMQHDGLKSDVLIEAGQHNLFFLNEQMGKKEWMNHQGKALEGLEICLTPEFFMNFFPENGRYMQQFLNNILKKRSAVISNYRTLVTPSMLQILQDIIHCDKPMALKKLFLSSRIMELLMLQIDQVQFDDKKHSISKGNKEKLHELKSYLDSKLEPEFSLKTLAMNFATNEFTLKKEFKLLFGKSIFEYWNGMRFDYAKRLLKEGCSIKQLANQMGYSNPQNFSTAFKKRYGIPPSFFKMS